MKCIYIMYWSEKKLFVTIFSNILITLNGLFLEKGFSIAENHIEKL